MCQNILLYLPNIFTIISFSIILVFAIFIYKRNSYKYGITLIVTSIIFLALDIIFISIQGADLAYRLNVGLGLPAVEVALIISTVNLIFGTMHALV